jgi:hypothetical protein
VARSDWLVGGEEPPAVPGDGVAPIAGTPTATFIAPQTMSATTVVHIAWPEASDPSGIAAYELHRRKGAGSWRTILLPAPDATSVDAALMVGARYSFRLRAVDGAGNRGPWATGPAGTVRLVEETSPAITYVNPFRRVVLYGASGDHVRKTPIGGRLARLTFTGSSVALVSTMGPARGIALVRINGGAWESVDLYSAAQGVKRLVWAASVAHGTHTLEVRVTGERNPSATSSRVDIDAFLAR